MLNSQASILTIFCIIFVLFRYGFTPAIVICLCLWLDSMVHTMEYKMIKKYMTKYNKTEMTESDIKQALNIAEEDFNQINDKITNNK